MRRSARNSCRIFYSFGNYNAHALRTGFTGAAAICATAWLSCFSGVLLIVIELTGCDDVGCPMGYTQRGEICHAVPPNTAGEAGTETDTDTLPQSGVTRGTADAATAGQGQSSAGNSAKTSLSVDAGIDASVQANADSGKAESGPRCGNGIVEAGESCDGNCPTAATCKAASACLVATITGDARSCSAQCNMQDITECRKSDGCCAPGCTYLEDDDCSKHCGDGVVEASETCDGNCPMLAADCDDGDPCSEDKIIGSASQCTAKCSSDRTTKSCVVANSGWTLGILVSGKCPSGYSSPRVLSAGLSVTCSNTCSCSTPAHGTCVGTATAAMTSAANASNPCPSTQSFQVDAVSAAWTMYLTCYGTVNSRYRPGRWLGSAGPQTRAPGVFRRDRANHRSLGTQRRRFALRVLHSHARMVTFAPRLPHVRDHASSLRGTNHAHLHSRQWRDDSSLARPARPFVHVADVVQVQGPAIKQATSLLKRGGILLPSRAAAVLAPSQLRLWSSAQR